MIRCKQCGDIKIDDNFRKYPRTEGRYKICLECERINNKYKYLLKKNQCTEEETVTLNKIEQLYQILVAKGLQVPKVGIGKGKGKSTDIDKMLEKYTAVEECPYMPPTPSKLQEWLDADLSQYTPDYLDEVYKTLKNSYRPMLGVDQDTLLPRYDDTYKVILDKILRRFDEREEQYYVNEGDKDEKI